MDSEKSSQNYNKNNVMNLPRRVNPYNNISQQNEVMSE